jgi:hypothetical protein
MSEVRESSLVMPLETFVRLGKIASDLHRELSPFVFCKENFAKIGENTRMSSKMAIRSLRLVIPAGLTNCKKAVSE